MNALDWFYRESFLNYYGEVPAVKPDAPKTTVVEQWDAATQTWTERTVALGCSYCGSTKHTTESAEMDGCDFDDNDNSDGGRYF